MNKVLVWLLGEFVGFERFVVLLVGMVTAYILTCSQYTAQARPLLMMTVVFENMFLERFVVNWYLTSGEAVTTSIMVSSLSCLYCCMLSSIIIGWVTFYSMDHTLLHSICLFPPTNVLLHIIS